MSRATARNPVTAEQVGRFIELIQRQEVTDERLEVLFRSGLLADLLGVHKPEEIEYSDFRQAIGMYKHITHRRFEVKVENQLTAETLFAKHNIEGGEIGITDTGVVKAGLHNYTLVHFVYPISLSEAWRVLKNEILLHGYKGTSVSELLFCFQEFWHCIAGFRMVIATGYRPGVAVHKERRIIHCQKDDRIDVGDYFLFESSFRD